MNKLGTARVLMSATILLIIIFQLYWLNKLYHEEDNNFKKNVDLVFRESMYHLQAERFKNDSLIFHGMLDDNLFLTDLVSGVIKSSAKKAGDSLKRKITISLKRDATFSDEHITDIIKKDTVMYVHSDGGDALPPELTRLLESSKHLNDSIPIKKIDSMYQALLAKEGIMVKFHIKTSLSAAGDSAQGLYITKKVPVGLLKAVFYQAVFYDTSWYIFKKISLHLLLSLLLVALTILSFIFIYRSLLAQKKLADIKNEFINNITHELKTPIATVNVAIEALRNFDGLNDPEKTKAYLDISALELQRLGMLVDNVLKLSMLENRAINLRKESFNLLELLQEVLVSMKLQFDQQGTTTSLEASGENFIIEADKLHITSVICNLLDNALKYSAENSQISVYIFDRVNYLEFMVKDNGIGISEEYRHKIFERFFRVPNGDRHNIKGYGLGLSYVSHIVRRHMGFIEVETAPGKGSNFIVKLPFVEAPVIRYDRNRKVVRLKMKL